VSRRETGPGGGPASPRRRPGRLWLFFYGRKRRGFPGLLLGLVAGALLLGLVYGLPGGADLSRWFIVVTIAGLVGLILGSLALVVVGALRGRRSGRRTGRR
jgi:peptidoglycan/LPS O-acetylase OafA/YrhL